MIGRFLQLPLFWKVLAPALLALASLLAYLGYSTYVFHRNNGHLEAVRNVHFPVLDTMTRNVAALDKIIGGLNSAAAAGDADMLKATEPVAKEISESYATLQKLDPEQSAAMHRLGAEFDAYYRTAHQVADGMVRQTDVDPAAMEKMATALDTYRKDLVAIRAASGKRFNDTVEDAISASNHATLGGMAFGLIGLAAGLGFAVLAARLITAPIKRAITVAHDVAEGRLDDHIEVNSDDEGGQLLRAMHDMQDALKRFVAGQTELADAHARGDTDRRMPAGEFKGIYAGMAEGINALVQAHIADTLHAMHMVSRYAQGDLSEDMARLPGKKAEITVAVDAVKLRLNAIKDDILRLSEAAGDGDFSARGDESAHEHAFRDMVAALNRLMGRADDNLKDVGRVISAIADGDLRQRVEQHYPGAFGVLAEDANRTAEQLAGIVGGILHASGTITTAAGEIASGNGDLSRRTEQQAANLEETAASMEELTSTVKQNAESARQANQLAQGAASVARDGGEVVGQVVSTMHGIEASSKKIAEIISVIDGIAFQTNILALNAAVEAARAGEQGRGFAVVASEVRSLAQRSAGAAKEIKGLIDDSVGKVADGSALVAKAGATMAEIVTSVQRVTDIMAEISAASQEQSAGIEQVNLTITQMDETTQQNAALVEEATAAARSMEEQAAVLGQAVATFRLDG